jgi:uncharacterized protein
MLSQFQETLISQTIAFVKSISEGEGSGHDWWHIYRVDKLAVYLAGNENADIFIVRLAALLHDLDDWKFNSPDSQNAKNWLTKCGMEEEELDRIIHIIQQVSYTGAGENSIPDSLESQIVQDADRLDALGAIGIARAFAYGGFKNREIFNPEILPVLHSDSDAYRKNQSHTINHFYEKLLLLKDRLNTSAAKEIASERHQFMEIFLKHFYQEWFLFEEDHSK